MRTQTDPQACPSVHGQTRTLTFTVVADTDLGPPFRGSAIPEYYYIVAHPFLTLTLTLTLSLTLTLPDPRNGGPPEWRAVTRTLTRRVNEDVNCTHAMNSSCKLRFSTALGHFVFLSLYRQRVSDVKAPPEVSAMPPFTKTCECAVADVTLIGYNFCSADTKMSTFAYLCYTCTMNTACSNTRPSARIVKKRWGLNSSAD